MQKAILLRGESTNQGTFGKLFVNTTSFFTLELPWKNDAPEISCISSGLYVCKYTLSPRLNKWTYEVFGDNKRAGIRIHSANLASQLLGCISLGEKLGYLNGVKAVLLSRPATTKLESMLNRQSFELEIK